MDVDSSRWRRGSSVVKGRQGRRLHKIRQKVIRQERNAELELGRSDREI